MTRDWHECDPRWNPTKMVCWWHTVRSSDGYYRDKEERNLFLVCITPVFSGIVIWGYGTVNDGICGVMNR